eukprot:10495318-Heterocapsa_arctica.AAC.1
MQKQKKPQKILVRASGATEQRASNVDTHTCLSGSLSTRSRLVSKVLAAPPEILPLAKMASTPSNKITARQNASVFLNRDALVAGPAFLTKSGTYRNTMRSTSGNAATPTVFAQEKEHVHVTCPRSQGGCSLLLEAELEGGLQLLLRRPGRHLPSKSRGVTTCLNK